MRRVLAVAATGSLVVGGLVAAAPTALGSTAAPSVRSSVHWGPCSDPDLEDAGARCGTVTAPLDYRHPHGAKVKLAVSRVRHTVPASRYQGVMLVNPGGPGGSGLDLATLGQFVPRGAGGAYDWIGFDPRGVGSSRPSLSCVPGYFLGPRPPYTPTSARPSCGT